MRKQIFVLVAIFAVTIGLTASGEAKSIEEILKEKGVITVEEYQEVVKQKPNATYVPGKGFAAESADGNYKLHIGGYAQLLYKYTDIDNQASNDKSDFNIRRFKLQISGNVVSKNFGYKFQSDMKSGFTTEDAFINYKFAAPLTIQFGQFKPAQARQELTSAAKQLFPERSLANDTFNLGRDLGVQAAGSFADKIVEYRLGLFNGNGPNTVNPDDRHMVTGRLDLNPLGAYAMDEAGWTSDKPRLNIGGSFAWNKVGASDVGNKFSTDNDVMDVALNLDKYATAPLTSANFTTAYGSDLTWLLWTANVNAAWMGATLAGEYYALSADPSLGSDWDADGYYVQAGYQVIPQTLELAARYSAVESTDAQASATFDKSETQFGVNYYFAKHTAKVQGDYTLVEDDLNVNKDDQVVRLQAQFYY
jgi:phosphate-selective porin